MMKACIEIKGFPQIVTASRLSEYIDSVVVTREGRYRFKFQFAKKDMYRKKTNLHLLFILC